MQKVEIKYIPNYLTLLRAILIPIIFSVILMEKYILAIVLVLISNITDILDGYIARKYELMTDWGKLADPLADKLTQISILTALIIKGIIPYWILIVVTTKEIIMIIGAFFLYKRKIVTVHSKWYGKTSTVLFFVAIVFSLLSKKFLELSNITLYLYYVAIAMALFAGVMYTKNIICKDYQDE